uniref:Uncharacterized protein n=1 Tax=Parastrongyloides trichosuri TaxID=131310 RepID=A0A0N4ZJQ6_PARTI
MYSLKPTSQETVRNKLVIESSEIVNEPFYKTNYFNNILFLLTNASNDLFNINAISNNIDSIGNLQRSSGTTILHGTRQDGICINVDILKDIQRKYTTNYISKEVN